MLDTMIELSDRELDLIAAGGGCESDSGRRDTDQNGLITFLNADHGGQAGLVNVNVAA
jgi:hypothetical protein